MKRFFMIFVVLLLSTFSISFAQVNWTKVEGNPLLPLGPSNSWEDDEVYAPCVIKVGDTLKMWYTGANSSGVDQIGYATSTDGILWQKYAQNPVLRIGSKGSWDSQLVVHPEVIFEGSTYHMWYGGSSDPNWYSFDAGYASSQDGIHWIKYDDPSTANPPYDQSDPVLKRGDLGKWDDATLAGVSCVFDGATFHMWYGGCDGANWANERIGYASSANGINWQKYGENPVFDGDGAWGADLVAAPFVIANTSGYKMWYSGSDGDHGQIGYATSHDGINWNPWSTPVLEPGASGTWDNADVGAPCVLFVDSLYHLWYSGATSTTGYRIGYATASPTGFEEIDSNDFPEDFVLNQNYPNPFNPTTTIGYQVRANNYSPVQVDLSIYNLLGQKVATLVNQKQAAGNYQVQWDASGFASGIYIYHLKVQGQKQNAVFTKKLVLLK